MLELADELLAKMAECDEICQVLSCGLYNVKATMQLLTKSLIVCIITLNAPI